MKASDSLGDDLTSPSTRKEPRVFDPSSPSPVSEPDLRREEPPENWRGGAAAISCLTFDVDAETVVLNKGQEHARDLSAMSHQAYGPRIGVPRILALLERYELEATFFVPGETAQRWPDTVRMILHAGHEVGCHGHTHRSLLQLTEHEQADDLERALAVLHALGADPRGYRAPNWQLTRETLDLLPSHGLIYDSSLMDDDRPYRVHCTTGTLVELPVHWSLDDWEQYAFLPAPNIGSLIELPSKVAALWTGELNAMRQTGGLCVVVCHPFLSGRPSRIAALETFIQFAHESTDVRIVRAGKLADELALPVTTTEGAAS
jgi:peptidoglycan-N-acetylglucosamine deacetylase